MLITVIGILLFVVDTNAVMIYVGIAFHQIIRGVVNVLSTVQINTICRSEIRASVASLNSSLAFIVFLVITGLFDILHLSASVIQQVNLLIVIILLGMYYGLQTKVENTISNLIIQY